MMELSENKYDKGAALAALQQRILACRRCQEHGYIPVAHPIVSGKIDNRILVIGQAPGHISVAKNTPFSGPGGRILQKWLEQAGFPRGYLHEHTYLSSLTRCDPGKNPAGEGDRKPSRQELALCRPFLDEELRLLQPKIVLLVGMMAIETFWGKTRLTDVIGTYKEQAATYWLPLPHPSGLSRWLNAPAHRAQLDRALALLADWRIQYEL
jgi:uracil-DNA glycosylase family 4